MSNANFVLPPNTTEATLDDRQITEVLRAAVDDYVYEQNGVVIPCPLVPSGKVSPEYFHAVTSTAHSILGENGVIEGQTAGSTDPTKSTSVIVAQTLRGRGIGIDCSGFVTSVASRGLDTLGIDPFQTRIPHSDFGTGYLIDGHQLDDDPEAAAKAKERQERLKAGDTDSEMRNDYDIQRIVDNSDPVEVDKGERMRAGDVIVYDPSDALKDPRQLGHVALITHIKGGRARMAHSGGQAQSVDTTIAIPVSRFKGDSPDAKTSVTVRRFHALQR